jgi:hypothetical protein
LLDVDDVSTEKFFGPFEGDTLFEAAAALEVRSTRSSNFTSDADVRDLLGVIEFVE